jgi:hypothetical protein
MTRPTAPAPTPSRGDQRVTQARVIRSEWTKLRTLPSSAWSLLVAAVLIVGFGALYAGVRVTRPPQDPAALASFDPTAVSLSGIGLAQLAIGVLGALLITGEYATGMIRTSSTATCPPRPGWPSPTCGPTRWRWPRGPGSASSASTAPSCWRSPPGGCGAGTPESWEPSAGSPGCPGGHARTLPGTGTVNVREASS